MVSEKLRFIRKYRQIRQADIAKELKLTTYQYRQIEINRKFATLKQLRKLAVYFKLPKDFLIYTSGSIAKDHKAIQAFFEHAAKEGTAAETSSVNINEGLPFNAVLENWIVADEELEQVPLTKNKSKKKPMSEKAIQVKQELEQKSETTIAGLRNFMNYTLKHYKGVDEIIFPLIGAILWYASANLILKVVVKDEPRTFVLFYTRKKAFFLIYNLVEERFELRMKTSDGLVAAAFNNKTSTTDLKRVFEKL